MPDNFYITRKLQSVLFRMRGVVRTSEAKRFFSIQGCIARYRKMPNVWKSHSPYISQFPQLPLKAPLTVHNNWEPDDFAGSTLPGVDIAVVVFKLSILFTMMVDQMISPAFHNAGRSRLPRHEQLHCPAPIGLCTLLCRRVNCEPDPSSNSILARTRSHFTSVVPLSSWGTQPLPACPGPVQTWVTQCVLYQHKVSKPQRPTPRPL